MSPAATGERPGFARASSSGSNTKNKLGAALRLGGRGGSKKSSSNNDSKKSLQPDESETSATSMSSSSMFQGDAFVATGNTALGAEAAPAEAAISTDVFRKSNKKKPPPEESSPPTDHDAVVQMVSSSGLSSSFPSSTTNANSNPTNANQPILPKAGPRHREHSDSLITVKTSNRQTDRNSLQQWHRLLVETEWARRITALERLLGYRDQLHALQQLTEQAQRETVTAARWVTGLARAEEQLMTALELGGDDDNDDDDALEEANILQNKNGRSEDPEDLPERRRDDGDLSTNGTNEAVALALEEDSSAKIGEEAVEDVEAAARATTTPRHSHKNGGGDSSSRDQPPIGSVTIPTRAAFAYDPVIVLMKQHNMLHQTLLTMLETGKTAAKMKELKEEVQASVRLLQEQATDVLNELKSTEEEVESAWDAYVTIAEDMLIAQIANSVGDKDSAAAPAGRSVADAWLAELAYRTALSRQTTAWLEQGGQLERFLANVKTGERQRRLKLRHFLQENVLQKHAMAFERVQEVHTEALESYFKHTGKQEDGNEAEEEPPHLDLALSKSNDSEAVKSPQRAKKKSTKNQVISTRERIEKLAKKCGTLPVFDDDDEREDKSAERKKQGGKTELLDLRAINPPIEAKDDDRSDEVVGIDLDAQMPAESDLDESDLPLLKDAARIVRKNSKGIGMNDMTRDSELDEGNLPVLEDPIRSATSSKSAKSRTNAKSSKRVTSSKKLTKSETTKKSSEKKVKKGVVLDKESSRNSAFLDRILYSGSLLESHYTQMAVVAGVDDDTPVPTKDVVEAVLIVITLDKTIHMFGIQNALDGNDAMPQEVILPGSRPEDAILYLSKRQAAQDLAEKRLLEEEKAKPLEEGGGASPIRAKFMRSRTVQKEEDHPSFRFRNLRPDSTLALEDYTVRTTNRGDFAVKITSNNSRGVEDNGYYKLNFASAADKQAFLLATQVGFHVDI